jgi:carbonic anhydrase
MERCVAAVTPRAAPRARRATVVAVGIAAKESAKRTAARVPTLSAIVGELVRAGKLKVAAAIYDLETGAVAYLD